MSDSRNLHVCPSCDSPYLTAQVITEVEINSNYEWELGYITTEDLTASMEYPDNPVYCPRCGWDGQMKDRKVVSIMNDAIHDEQPIQHKIPTTLNDIHVVTPSDKPIVFNIGDVVSLNHSEYCIIGKYIIKPNTVRRFDPTTYRQTTTSREAMTMYILTPLDQSGVPTGQYISLTSNQLYSAINNNTHGV